MRRERHDCGDQQADEYDGDDEQCDDATTANPSGWPAQVTSVAAFNLGHRISLRAADLPTDVPWV
jgi:hypothetical protein